MQHIGKSVLLALGLSAIAPAAAAQIVGETFSMNFIEVELEASVVDGELWVIGGAGNDTITLSLDDDGSILVNDGSVKIDGGPATPKNAGRIIVLGGDGNDTLIDATRLGAELHGGHGMDVLLWDDQGDLSVEHTFPASDDDRDFDLLLVNEQASRTSGGVAYFDGKFLTARDLGSSADAFEPGWLLIGEIHDDSGWSVADDVIVDGKIITADYQGYTTLSVARAYEGRVIKIATFQCPADPRPE